MENTNPQHLLNTFLKWFDKEKRTLFLLCFIFGFIINILLITNDILFTDAIVFTDVHISDQWELSLGRWLLHYLDYFRFGLASSVIDTILSLIYIGLSSILLIDLFDIKTKISKILLCLTLSVSPFLCELLLSVFCSAEFILSFLLSTLSVYFLYKLKNKYLRIILSSIFLACSLGLYQAFLGVACGLCILVPLQKLLTKDHNCKQILKKVIESVIMGILAVIIYWILLQLNLKYWNVSMASYSGADKIGLNTILNIPSLISDTIKSFKNYFFTDDIINNLFYKRNIINIVMFAVLFILILSAYIKSKQKKKALYIFEIILCLILTPICLGVIELIASERDINQLMCAPYILIFPFLLALLEQNFHNKLFKNAMSWLVTIIMVYTIISYSVMANATYMAMRIKTNNQVHVTDRIIDLIDNTDNYNSDMKVIFFGNSTSSYYSETSNRVFLLSSGHAVKSPLIWSNAEICNRGWHNFILHHYGIDLQMGTYEEYTDILNTKEFEQMPAYPNKKSVQVINNIMVVKMQSDPSKER